MKLSAFSLLELIVVMAIIGITAALGIFGFVSFRRSVQFGQAVNEVVAVIKETRNLAKSNTLPKTVVINAPAGQQRVYAYNLNFQGNELTRTLCYRVVGTPDTAWTCFDGRSGTIDTREYLKSSGVFADINYTLTANTSCYDTLYENLTGDVKVAKAPDSDNRHNYAEDRCTITVTQNYSGARRNVFISGVQNTFGIEP